MSGGWPARLPSAAGGAGIHWLCLLVLTGCGTGLKPLPEQRASVEAEDPPDYHYYARMAVRADQEKIVQDIGGSSGLLRWTAGRPAVRLRLPDAGPWVARMEFTLAEATWRDTGVVTIGLYVNGRQVGEGRFNNPGEHSMTAPVPREALAEGGAATLEARISPVWVAPDDGAELGVMLKGMGFLRR